MEALAFEGLSLFYVLLIYSVSLWLGSNGRLRAIVGIKDDGDEVKNLIVTFVTGFAALGLLAYACFWIYYANRHIGKAISFVALGFGLWRMIRLKDWLSSRSEAFRFIIYATLAIALFYAAALYLFPSNPQNKFLEEVRFRLMPGDNELQKILATRLRKGVALSPFYGEWQASDRPPLLSAFYLLFTWNNEPIFYRALAFAVQLLWVPAVVVFALSLRQSRSLIGWALLGISLNGFVLLNSVYTWPKMQSAAYFIFGLSVLTARFNYASNRSRGILSGVSFGLSFISHAGIVFTAPVVLSLFFFQKMNWEQLSSKLRTIGFSIALFILVFIPWRLFQVFVDPPGDQILKLHIFNRTDRLPMSQLFLEVYGKLTLNEWIVLRVENFKNLIGEFRWPWQVSLGEEFAYLTHGLGLVDVIIPAAVCGLYLFARGRRIAALGMVFWGSLISLGLWLCVMLLPIFIGNHLNSYAIYLLLLTGAYLTIGKAARVVMPICILMACYRLLSIWVASNPNGGNLDLAQLGILGGALVWMIFVIRAWSSQVKYLELS